jgi:hypothetical protein
MKISAVMIYTGRLYQASESIASFLQQDYEDRELLVVSTCTRQTLIFDHPLVRIYNLKEFVLPMAAKSGAMNLIKGEIVIAWDELSIALPHFLSGIADAIQSRPWCWLNQEFCFESLQTLKVDQASEFSFAFRREIWTKVGPYPPGINGACDRNLMGKITQMFPGAQTSIHSEGINLIRLWTREERERIQPDIRCGQIRLQPALQKDYDSIVSIAKTGKRESRLCVVQLGRYGDIISILPILKHIADNYEVPYLMVSSKFADLLDGVSYVKPFVTQLSNEKLGQALSIAKAAFQIVLNAGVWGEGHQQRMATKSYCTDAWNNLGYLSMFYDPSVKPVFDQRDIDRELNVIEKLVDNPQQKPIICLNLKDAISSPCPKCPSLIDQIRATWQDQALIIDLAGFKAHRIYDLLGLFEISKCLVCVDSAFVHLAQATEIGIVIIKNPKPWAGTIVRRNLAAETDYEKLDMQAIHEGIANCLACVK